MDLCAYQNLKFLSLLLFLKYATEMIPITVENAARMLSDARIIVDILIDLAPENLNSSRSFCWATVRLFVVWKLLLKPVLSSRDSNHPTPPAIPEYGNIGVFGRAAARLAMAWNASSTFICQVIQALSRRCGRYAVGR